MQIQNGLKQFCSCLFFFFVFFEFISFRRYYRTVPPVMYRVQIERLDYSRMQHAMSPIASIIVSIRSGSFLQVLCSTLLLPRIYAGLFYKHAYLQGM